MMTQQEIFDKVARHLLTQKAKSLTTGPVYVGCAYRGDGGTKCAIGCLIPDEVYDPEIEGVSPTTYDGETPNSFIKLMGALTSAGIPTDKDTLPFLNRLQSIHDEDPIERWRAELSDFATKHNLYAAVVEEFPCA